MKKTWFTKEHMVKSLREADHSSVADVAKKPASRLIKSFAAMVLCAQPFLANTASSADCAAVTTWVAEAQTWSMGKDLNSMQARQVRELVGPVFHDEVMRKTWRQPWRDLSPSARARIHKALMQCDVPVWAKAVLVTPFSNPPDVVKNTPGTDYQQWQATIENVNRQPWTAWQARKQQLADSVARQEQRRADWVAGAPERERLAREAAVAAQRQREHQARQVEQQIAARHALVARHRDRGPFGGSDGAAYLNALYHDDRDALKAFDEMFAAGFAAVPNAFGSKEAEAMFTALGGEAEAKRLANLTKNVVPNLTLVVPVAVSYVVYFERAYPRCMDKNPHVFERTTEYEWVDRNGFGQVMRSSPAWTHTDTFRINDQFMGVWEHRGSIEQNETQIADFLFGKSGAIRAYDAMLAANLSMHKFDCDSAEIRTLEANMLRYFNDRIAQAQQAAGK